MNKRIYIFTMYMLVAFSLIANVTFKAIPPANVLKGDKFQITFSLQNGSASDFVGPQIEGCRLLSDKGVSSFSSYQNINGKTTASKRIDYTCLYRAEKIGKVIVPAVTITVDGKQYKSAPITFTIAENTGKPNQRVQTSIFDEEYTSQTPGTISGDELFVRIILSKESAYEQEPIECVIKLYTQYGINSFMPTTQPSFDGFIIEEIPVKSAINQIETYNGKDYYTAILKRCLIFPQKSGKLTINSGKYELVAEKYEKVSFGGGYAYSRVPIQEKLSISSNSANMTIKALPLPQPTNFSGAVGEFDVNAKLTSSSFRTNEATSLVYTITGSGNVKYIKEPNLDFPVEFELYTPKSKYDSDVSNGTMAGVATFEYTFVPKSVGKFQIPKHEFVYFNPNKSEYITKTIQPFIINVSRGISSVEQDDVKTKNIDIRHIKLGNKNQGEDTLIILSVWYWAVIILLIVIFICLIYYYNKRRELYSDIVGLKLAKANKVAKKRLKLAFQYMNNAKQREFYEEIQSAIWGYISDKLSIPKSQLSKDNITLQMLDLGIKEEICNEIINILNKCEIALYTPQSDNSQMKDIYDCVVKSINEIESIKIKRK